MTAQGARQLIIGATGEAGGALFSACGRFRYRLWRRWDNRPHLLAIGANPSIAGSGIAADDNDPTVRRWMGFAKAWEFGGLEVANVFGLVSTDPKGLAVADPVGAENDWHIAEAARAAGLILASWGEPWKKAGRHVTALARERVQFVRDHILRPYDVYCLGRTASGEPRHPLYIPKSQPRELLWSAQR